MLFSSLLLFGQESSHGLIEIPMVNGDFDHPTCPSGDGCLLDYTVGQDDYAPFENCVGPNWHHSHGTAIDYIPILGNAPAPEDCSGLQNYVNLYSRKNKGEGIYYDFGCAKMIKGNKYEVRLQLAGRTHTKINDIYVYATRGLEPRNYTGNPNYEKPPSVDDADKQLIASAENVYGNVDNVSRIEASEFTQFNIEFTAKDNFSQIWIYHNKKGDKLTPLMIKEVHLYEVCEHHASFTNTDDVPGVVNRGYSITIGGGVTLKPGQNVILNAPTVNLDPGFVANYGTQVTVLNSGCGDGVTTSGIPYTFESIQQSVLDDCSTRLRMNFCKAPVEPVTYDWGYGLPNAREVQVSPLVETQYTVKATDANGDMYFASTTVSPENQIEISASDFGCGNKVLKTTCQLPGRSYEWYSNGRLFSTQDTTMVSSFFEGTYQVKIIDDITWDFVFATYEMNNISPEITMVNSTCGYELSVCDDPSLIYRWFYNDYTNGVIIELGNSSSIIVNPKEETRYELHITDPVTGERIYRSRIVPARPFAIISSETTSNLCDGTIKLQTNYCDPNGVYEYLWMPNGETSETIIVSTTDDVVYTVQVTNTITGEVEIAEFNVNTRAYTGGIKVDTPPNVLTPNGDGYNERLKFFDLSNYDGYAFNAYKISVLINNRWGAPVHDQVYQVGHPGFSPDDTFWDPSNNSDGTYYYYIKFENCENTKEFTGWIQVIRGTSKSGSVNPNDQLEIVVYPNPTSDFLNVSILQGSDEETVFTLHSLSGEQVDAFTFDESNNYQIDLSNPPSGIYIITINTAREIIEKRIVLEK